MMYFKMQKALYGMLEAAQAFYKLLRKKMEDEGFVVNTYDLCVTNKVINSNQMTVT